MVKTAKKKKKIDVISFKNSYLLLWSHLKKKKEQMLQFI